MKEKNIELAKGTLENLYDDNFNIYKAFTTAEEKLFLSYCQSDTDGKSLRPSTLILKIKKIFPKLIEKNDILEKENIYIKDLTCGYYLKTTRHDIILPDGVLSLDENEYNHHHDYEIEFEVEDYDQGLQTFKKIIQPYHLEYKQNCLSKIKRMLETLKNE